MRCPNCGAAVKIRGDQWECGWCGDFGRLRRVVREPAERPEASEAERRRAEVRAQLLARCREAWQGAERALVRALGRGRDVEVPGLAQAALYEIGLGLAEAGRQPAPERLEALSRLLLTTQALGRLTTPRAVQEAADRGEPLFAREGELTEARCGAFWAALLDALPRGEDPWFPSRPLADLLWQMGELHSCFSGEEDGCRRCRELEDALYPHWRRHGVCRPDAARACRLLRRGNFPAGEDICREILVAAYPRLAEEYPLEDLACAAWDGLIRARLETDPPLAVAMWRTLLNAAGPGLAENEGLARVLLPDWIEPEWLQRGTESPLPALLAALEEEDFARQVFQSASVAGLQRDLLRACGLAGRREQGEKLLDLLRRSPFPRGRWKLPLRSLERALERDAPREGEQAGPPPDDGALFRFCGLRFPGSGRIYTYLAGEAPVAAGDWVTAPFGPRNTLRRGQVVLVETCPRSAAPRPPEQCKTVAGPAAPLEDGGEPDE